MERDTYSGIFKDEEVHILTPSITLTNEQLGWMTEPESTIPLEPIILSNGKEIYFGNAIKGRGIQRYMENNFPSEQNTFHGMNEQMGELLFFNLDRFFLNDTPDYRGIKQVREAKSTIPIYYCGKNNKIGSNRVYFVHLGIIEEEKRVPVILHVASCPNKNQQDILYRILSEIKNPRIH